MGGGRRLTDLRVLELRQELEKRGLDKSGIKAVLVERLTMALKKEGVDVENFLVDQTEPAAAAGAMSGGAIVKIEDEEMSDNQIDSSMVIDEDQMDTSQSSEVESQEGEGVPGGGGQETVLDEVAADTEEEEDEALVSEKDPVKGEERDNSTSGTIEGEAIKVEKKDDVEEVQIVKEIQAEGDESTEKNESTLKNESSVGGKEGNVKNETISSVEEVVEVEVVDTTERVDDVSSAALKTKDAADESKGAKGDEGEVAVGETGVPEDDHDELHITIGEEEDKFIMDEGEEIKAEPGTKKQASIVTNEKTTDAKSDQLNSTEAHVEVKEADKSETTNNDASSATNQAKSIDNSIEGRAQRKSREENRDTLLVTGLSAETAATDLKNIFKKYGKIGGVKIMLSAKDPGASRFALVAVLASEDVETCIQKLDGYELHGRIIHVQKAGTDMLSADWSRKEGTREAGIKRNSNAISKSSSSRLAAKSTSEEDKAKRTKKSSDTTTSKSEPRRKSASEKSSSSKDKEKKSSSAAEDKDKKKTESSKPSREKDKREGGGRGGRGDFSSRSFRGRMRGGFRDLPHHTQGGLRVRPRVQMGNRREFGQMGGRRDFQRRSALNNREGRDLIPRSPPRYHRQEVEPPRRGGRAELTFEDIYDIRQREKVREVEREKREIERRRLEDEEKQQQLDLEIRQLAKQREKIEQEKLELKRQKERMILEEREKQKLERERIQREKEELARRLDESRRLVSSAKRNDVGFDLTSERKKVSEDRSRHRDSFVEPSYIKEKEKLRHEPYRRAEASRYGQISDDRHSRMDSAGRVGSVRSAPERDTRAPVWAKGRAKSRERSPDRSSHHRDREALDSRLDDRKSKMYTQVVQLSASSQVRFPPEAASTHFSIPTSAWTREVETKAVDNYAPNLRDNRWAQRSAPAYNAESHSSPQLSSVRADSWTARESAWIQPERAATRPIVDIPERWASGTGTGLNPAGRSSAPVAPPPPIYSGTANSIAMSSHGAGASSYLGTRSYDYDYKLSSAGQRR